MIKMNKKTNFPDLERLPNHNHLKHFINWLWNKPQWLFEDLYEKYFLKQKIELEEAKLELEKKDKNKWTSRFRELGKKKGSP